MSYSVFIRDHWRFLGFGFLFNLTSSFGQTFFVARFAGEIRAEFGLSHAGFGGLYSAATLASAATLVWLGRKLDETDLRRYSAGVAAGLVVACFAMAVVPHVLLLVPALYAIRLAGQGLMTHTAMSSMARYFEAQRGRAMSLASLGRPAGEAVLPAVIVPVIAAFGWRLTWAGIGAVLALSLGPLLAFLLRGHDERHRQHLEEQDDANKTDANTDATGRPRRAWTRAQVIRDPHFHAKLPCVLATPFLLTGFFFHQIHLADSKGWSQEWFAMCFSGYAVATVVSSLFGGPLIDKFGSKRLLPYYLLPLATGLALLMTLDHPLVALAFLVLSGTSMGLAFIVLGGLWPEMYGVTHVGAIRSLTSSLMVLSTAIAPVAMGVLIDAGMSMETLAALSIGYVAASIAVVLVDRRFEARR